MPPKKQKLQTPTLEEIGKEPYVSDEDEHTPDDIEVQQNEPAIKDRKKVRINRVKRSESGIEIPLDEQFDTLFASNTLPAVSKDEVDKEGNLVASATGWDPDPTEESAASTKKEIEELQKKYIFPKMTEKDLAEVRKVEENTKKNKENSVATEEFFDMLREKKKDGFHLIHVERTKDSEGVHYDFEWAEAPNYTYLHNPSEAPTLSVKRKRGHQITSVTPDFYKKFLEHLGIFDRVQAIQQQYLGYSYFPSESVGKGGKTKRKSTKRRNKKFSTKKRKSIKRK
jgi:hypothetical protein